MRLPIYIAPYNRPYAEPPMRPTLRQELARMVRPVVDLACAAIGIATCHPGDHIIARQPSSDRRRIEALNRALRESQAGL